MSWNYRIVERDECFGIHEAYYNKIREVDGMTKDSVKLECYESVDELIEDLECMLKDARRYKDKVLDYDMKFPNTDEESPLHNHSED